MPPASQKKRPSGFSDGLWMHYKLIQSVFDIEISGLVPVGNNRTGNVD